MTRMCNNLCQQGLAVLDMIRVPEMTKPQFYPKAKNIRVGVKLGHYLLPCFKTLLNLRSPVYEKDEIKLL